MGPAELKDLGFDLIVWPLAPLYSTAKALNDVYTTLRREGSTLSVLDRLITFDNFNEIVGLDAKYALDAKYRSK
jgi:methylisocitrate lyase